MLSRTARAVLWLFDVDALTTRCTRKPSYWPAVLLLPASRRFPTSCFTSAAVYLQQCQTAVVCGGRAGLGDKRQRKRNSISNTASVYLQHSECLLHSGNGTNTHAQAGWLRSLPCRALSLPACLACCCLLVRLLLAVLYLVGKASQEVVSKLILAVCCCWAPVCIFQVWQQAF